MHCCVGCGCCPEVPCTMRDGSTCEVAILDLEGGGGFLPGERYVCSFCEGYVTWGTGDIPAPSPRIILPGDPDFHF